jgi:hypothetical protein
MSMYWATKLSAQRADDCAAHQRLCRVPTSRSDVVSADKDNVQSLSKAEGIRAAGACVKRPVCVDESLTIGGFK